MSEAQVLKMDAYMLFYYKKSLQPKSFPISLEQFGACVNKCDDFVIDVDDGCLSRRLNLSERVTNSFVGSIEDNKEYCLSCLRHKELYLEKINDNQVLTVGDSVSDENSKSNKE